MFTQKRIVSFFVAFLMIFTSLPLNVFAQPKPWTPYEEYIPEETPLVKRHLRAVWLTTVLNLDWPSVETRDIENSEERIQKSKEELVEMLDRAVELNMNAVFFQVSTEGDALYNSDIVPWSRYLTGTFGKDPGFDPLAFIIKEAHKRNLELHAWLNPYRVSMNTSASTIESLNIPKSIYRERPHLIKTSMNRFIVDPGVPESRKWVADRVKEILDNYDVDGIHFDDYFYYERHEGELNDDETFRKYNNGQFSNKGDWRRNNTYLLIKELSEMIQKSKPHVKFGISPGGVWGNKSDGLVDGSNTESGYTNYLRCFADTKKWVEEEIIDYIAPQIYFTFGNPRAPYGEVASWWSNLVKGRNVHLYIGQALYKVNDDADEYFVGANAVPEFTRQLKFNVAKPETNGTIMFRYKNLEDGKKQEMVNVIENDLWSSKTLVPVMPWKGGSPPKAPEVGKVEEVSDGVKISWHENDENTVYYAVYRFNTDENANIVSDESAAKLIGTVRRNDGEIQKFIDRSFKNLDDVFYVVTALDRLHNESTGLLLNNERSKYFPDVGYRHLWAMEAIDRFYKMKIIRGDHRGMFNPGANTKRGDFIIMVVNALGLKAEYEKNFLDVKKDSYYYDSIAVARELGIIKGVGNERFNPEGNITREDMMVIVTRALEILNLDFKKSELDNILEYDDVDEISEYAFEAVASLTVAGLVRGFAGGIHPKRMATRAEIVIILNSMLDKIS
ncbi:family 10 glycosylhydrolase [Herbivorax sp. ANBcel31]|uniref:family 10 glycosylhydrolase n=1 Tax=Herbivorax sp. ANBcel31 TaxID=3069754 RepID=UPI0027B1F5F1|nr:family 10 glycosylhydrolase [Herbivorax sp. ANBcel31]MDQ2087575.1 family 10 glycosylhydrolase [Herbivorax sp. ANBcel31]